MPLPLGFTGARLDRADRLRTDAEAFAAATQDPRATCLAMDGIDPVPGERGGLIWEPLDPADDRALLLLGIDDAGAPRFVRAPAPGADCPDRRDFTPRLFAAVHGGSDEPEYLRNAGRMHHPA